MSLLVGTRLGCDGCDNSYMDYYCPNVFCGGAFGRDAVGPFRVEAVGFDWVVVRDEHGKVYFTDSSPDQLLECVCK